MNDASKRLHHESRRSSFIIHHSSFIIHHLSPPMLKALEIVGFKSFADRTRFEFPPGVTVVVGPNGSGKSNIVDAIKWVLGEQSVKSLRGHEMADVIFNGSASRRALNAAEITLTFDNSKRLLPLDAPEVHITRRVYRSGEGEYLINRNPARLRDIRDLLSGTGMGTQAYSVIEQGKVDGLLQSSPRDRRVIFEEAAGISRFKMRKIEALRRLEHVEQNLLRLSDIVDEVENRLRSVRAQAGKARRYKEHTDRLQELRTQVGQVDWKRLTERLNGFESQSAVARATSAAPRRPTPRTIDAQLLELDHGLGQVNEEIRQAESQIAVNRERIAAAEAAIEHERSRGVDLEQEIVRYRRQLVGMSAKAGDLQQQLRDTTDSLQAAETNHREVAKRLVEAERGLDRGDGVARSASRRERATPGDLSATDAAGRVAGQRNQFAGKPGGRRLGRAAAMRRAHGRPGSHPATPCNSNWTSCGDSASKRARRVEEETQSLAAAVSRLGSTPRAIRRPAEGIVGDARAPQRRRRTRRGARRTGAPPRGTQRRREGRVAAGRRSGRSVFRGVRGLVADVFHVSVEVAPLVEIALGQTAQHVVAARQPGIARLSADRIEPSCRPRRLRLARDDKGVGSLYLVKTPDPFTRSQRTAGRPRKGRSIRRNAGGVRAAGRAAAGPNVVRRNACPGRFAGRPGPVRV